MAENMLSQGILKELRSVDSSDDLGTRPTLQCVDVRVINRNQGSSSSGQRFRLILSDGMYKHQAMLATQLNDLVHQGNIKEGSILRLDEFLCNTVQARRVIIILGANVVGEWNETIGNPVDIGNDSEVVEQPAQSNSYAAAQPPQAPYGNRQPYVQAYGVSSNEGAVPAGANYGSGGYPAMSYAQEQQRQQTPMHAGSMQQPTRQFYGSGPVMKDDSAPRIVPVKSLNPYQNKWTIEARVTSKGEVRTYTNAKGSGKVLNFDLIDEHCGEIRCVCFNEAADKWDPVIIPGKTYRISRGTLSQANKRFNNLNTDYEIRLDSSSQVQPIEDQGTIPSMNFNLWNLADIENFESGTTVDTMGVVLRVGEQSSITRRDMSTAYRRSISLADQTARIELTLWDRFAQQEGAKINEAAADASKKPIVAIKGARVGSFNGVTLNSTSNCQVVLHPPLKKLQEAKQLEPLQLQAEDPDVKVLSGAPEGGGGRGMRSVSVEQLKRDTTDRSVMPMSINLHAWVTKIKAMKSDRSMTYPACDERTGERQCGKKMQFDQTTQSYKCERHLDTPKSDPEFRYMCTLEIQDHTGTLYPSLIGDAGETLFGMPAEEFHSREEDGVDAESIMSDAQFRRWNFRIRAQLQNFNDEERIKYNVNLVERLDWAESTRAMLNNLRKLERGEAVEVPPRQRPSFQQQPGVQFQQQLPQTAGMGWGGEARAQQGGAAQGSCFKCGGDGHWFGPIEVERGCLTVAVLVCHLSLYLPRRAKNCPMR